MCPLYALAAETNLNELFIERSDLVIVVDLVPRREHVGGWGGRVNQR